MAVSFAIASREMAVDYETHQFSNKMVCWKSSIIAAKESQDSLG